ncbi:MAG: hypothetical protein SFX73_09855 [Kofleriaceae bacterium]|nr:hypothetical protein [Kofleriaceae bacterium]
MSTRSTIFCLALFASTAHADRAAKADALFKQGKKQLVEKHYSEACATFEEVDKLDPGIGAKLNVARCYEEWGRLAVAYRWYEQAIATASASKDERLPKIKQLAEDLDANVPRITIKVQAGANPDIVATITLDGKPLDPSKLNVEVRVDPGPHRIEYVLDGQKKAKMAPVERGGSAELSLDIPKGTGRPKQVAKKRLELEPDTDGGSAPSGGRTRRILGLTLAGGGVAAIGVAGALTLTARTKYNKAIEEHCIGDPTSCDETGLEITHSARSRANVATIITVGGAVLVGVGLVLYLHAPGDDDNDASREKSALYLAPSVGTDGGTLVLGGSF